LRLHPWALMDGLRQMRKLHRLRRSQPWSFATGSAAREARCFLRLINARYRGACSWGWLHVAPLELFFDLLQLPMGRSQFLIRVELHFGHSLIELCSYLCPLGGRDGFRVGRQLFYVLKLLQNIFPRDLERGQGCCDYLHAIRLGVAQGADNP